MINVFQWFFLSLSFFTLAGCNYFDKEEPFPEGFRYWEVHVISPSYYPVMIDEAYGVNEKEDWTLYVTGFGGHTWAKSELNNARKKIPDYDGFGLPLHVISTTSGSQSGTRTLPESIYIYWASLAEGKFYVNKFDLTLDMREAMMTDDPETLSNGNISHCYQKDIAVGLLPGGKMKVWRLGCNKFTFMGEVSAAKEFESYPSNIDYYEAMQKKAEKRAADNDVELFPIPYEKVDQVFEYVPIPRCSNKALWGCS
ncbi:MULTISPECIES: DUF2931 family protein [unclassified Marinomonas]|uniref:DUF2931 family protein n=1 Tax=unclassified Marinomonas TaxID=196814 RepID=UPI0007AF1CF4|nr:MULTISPECIES: DUF2931 family protein [unclassified Marinomonas]